MSVNFVESKTQKLTVLVESSSGSAGTGSSGGSGGGRGRGRGRGRGDDQTGLLNEYILVILVESMKWDIRTVCILACVCWRLRALAKRLLWKSVCKHRAPTIVDTTLAARGDSRHISVEWQALAKVLFYCGGCPTTSRHFHVNCRIPGHFLTESRFSKTSGNSFLIKKCRDDLLYVTDPCEHSIETESDRIIGIFRGVFSGFSKSRTRAYLIGKKMPFEEVMRCPYCACRVWSMTEARLVPKSSARRLACDDGMLEYFVCINGHLHGQCWLLPLSDDEDGGDSHSLSWEED